MSVNPPIQKQRKRIEQIQFVQNLHRPELSAMLPYQISFKLIYRIITFPCNPYYSSIIHHRHQLVQNETDIFSIQFLFHVLIKNSQDKNKILCRLVKVRFRLIHGWERIWTPVEISKRIDGSKRFHLFIQKIAPQKVLKQNARPEINGILCQHLLSDQSVDRSGCYFRIQKQLVDTYPSFRISLQITVFVFHPFWIRIPLHQVNPRISFRFLP